MGNGDNGHNPLRDAIRKEYENLPTRDLIVLTASTVIDMEAHMKKQNGSIWKLKVAVLLLAFIMVAYHGPEVLGFVAKIIF